MTLWQKIVCMGAIGGCGTLARWWVASRTQAWLGTNFPWSTLMVNGIGCGLFGLVVGVSKSKDWLGYDLTTILLIGFMGAFTTFSTFAADTVALLQAERYAAAVGNLLLENGVGITAVALGLMAARAL